MEAEGGGTERADALVGSGLVGVIAVVEDHETIGEEGGQEACSDQPARVRDVAEAVDGLRQHVEHGDRHDDTAREGDHRAELPAEAQGNQPTRRRGERRAEREGDGKPGRRERDERAQCGCGAEIVREGDDHDEQDQRHANRREPLVDGRRHRTPPEPFDERDDDVAAVERQQRQEIEERERHAHQPEQQEVPLHTDAEELVRRADDPHRPGELRAPSSANGAAQAGHRAGHDAPAIARRQPRARRQRVSHEQRRRGKAPDPPPLVLDRPARAERHLAPAALHRDRDRAPVACADQPRHLREGPRPMTVDRDDAVARLESGRCRRRMRPNLCDLGARAL